MQDIIRKSIYISLLVQIITTAISLDGLNYTLTEKDKVLKDILKLEAFVQFVETGFYVWIINSITNLDKVTPRRYLDWFITTPTMLISTIIFMKYADEKENNNQKITLWEFLKSDSESIKKIIILNFMMLIFGLLGELGYGNKYLMISIGFIFFYYLFKHIYEKYAIHSKIGYKLFVFLVIVWSMYGISAMMSLKYKNLCYNFLDIISKNFYGLFIYYKILQAKY